MICISVTPKSRKLAKVDLLNASNQGDLVELCLDHLAKEPNVGEMITGISKPVLISCRRRDDGGAWEGTEEDRLRLLRQAIVAGPAYVELDLDIAPRIPRFGDTKRVISFTRMDRPETDIETVFDEAAAQNADIVKFTWPTPTLDDAWPLLVAVSGKRRIPIVGLGLGRADLTFSLLGRKYGSPWIYAALERGMEAFPGQATVFELDDIYRWRDINKSTAFVAVAGFGPAQTITTRILNSAFAQLSMNVRCLPIEFGDLRELKRMLDKLQVRAVIVGARHGDAMFPYAETMADGDAPTQHVSLLLKRTGGEWKGYNALWREALKAVESALGGDEQARQGLSRRNVLVLGAGGAASTMIAACKARGGIVSICANKDAAAQTLAGRHECRHVPYQNVYDTLADVVVIADPDLRCGVHQGCINPALLKASMVVVDVSDPPTEHLLFEEARQRGCKVISPESIYLGQLRAEFKAITGRDLPSEAIEAGMES